MIADDAPGMDAPAILAENLSNAGLATRPALTLGGQPGAVVVLIEITVKDVAA